PRRADLAAEPAVHALRDVDVEAVQHHLARLFVLWRLDEDAVDRTRALAGETAGADLEIDRENAAIAERQRVLDADRHAVRVLHGVGPTDEVRERDRHPLEDGAHGLL